MSIVNKNNKDRLFRLLFGDERYKTNTLELYNAINGTSYTNPDELEFNTIDDFIYMGMKNDTSFIIRDDLSIFEQQSTYNPNMPVRGLMYLGKVYDSYIKSHKLNIYGKTQITLPVPQYVVFYNGTEANYRDKDVFELKLSDAFSGKTGCVEVTAIVYNVNYGHNDRLMKACRALSEYAAFVNEIRNNRSKGMELKDAINLAVNVCLERNILKDILLKHKAEVEGMIFTEYDELETIENTKVEGMEYLIDVYNWLRHIGRSDDAAKLMSGDKDLRRIFFDEYEKSLKKE
ncbi:hypothetical protein SAMN05216390_1064 [Lachnospiraceae bacterium KH1T2]|nr:hypothetical protein SAMN05216390_1064 [Lachnospiraceae bacterium KH1T2]